MKVDSSAHDNSLGGGLSNAAVTDIYNRYGHLLLRRCRVLMRDDAAADDALQDAFVKIMRHGGAFWTVDSKLGWLYRVVDNCCFDAQKRRRERPAPDEELERASTNAAPSPVARIAVSRALERLHGRERQLAVLALVDSAGQQQFASEVGWSRQTVNKKLGDVRRRLARWLDGE
jgi:RNA polymerase sigma factor (sigma-70 family)